MSDFEVMPVGTATRLGYLEAENNGERFTLSQQGKPLMPEMVALQAEVKRLRVELEEERRDLEKTEAMCAEHCAELEQLRSATQLCDKHAPKGGTVAACVICSGQKLSYALSRISYLCEPPNEMEFSSYDLYYNEDAVVAQVEQLRADAERYRWLRDSERIRCLDDSHYYYRKYSADRCDAAIDAAKSEGQR